jgi:Kef-type K+ transport system membrane component KefB
VIIALVGAAAEAAEGMGHQDPIASVVLFLAIILVAAKIGGDLATRVRQPAVLGELIAGILLGNLTLAGYDGLEVIKHNFGIELLSGLGVILLLFEVGLESTVGAMLKVGWSSLLVAVIGVMVPFGLGWGVGAWLLPEASVYVHAFLGATLTATSVGITARVFKDLDYAQTGEARIILGAAVIDDVLGLVILAIVIGIIAAADQGGTLSLWAVGGTLAKAAGFLIGSLLLGVLLAPKLFGLASRLRARGVLLASGLSLCFLLSWLAGAVGLAPIVGAFSAGLVLESVHYRDFTDRGEHALEELVHPIASFLVPVFFVLMGMRTDLRAFAQPGVAMLAVALTVAAVLGKQFAGLGVLTRGVDRIMVGLGMIPRGEVGLIFANMGLALAVAGERIVTKEAFAAVVVMVVVTTLLTPPAIRWRLAWTAGRSRSDATAGA